MVPLTAGVWVWSFTRVCLPGSLIPSLRWTPRWTSTVRTATLASPPRGGTTRRGTPALTSSQERGATLPSCGHRWEPNPLSEIRSVSPTPYDWRIHILGDLSILYCLANNYVCLSVIFYFSLHLSKNWCEFQPVRRQHSNYLSCGAGH